MVKKLNLSESLENYLEIILALQNKHRVARSKDIAQQLNIKRGSVTGALKSLSEKKLINYEPYGFITLTPAGKKIAEEITYKHFVIKDFLHRILQISSENADATACKIEHAMDKKSFDMLVKFIRFIDNCPKAGTDWIQAFTDYCSDENPELDKCKECISKCESQLDKN